MCLHCGKTFSSKRRPKMKWIQEAYEDYTVHKQSYKELSEKYGKSGKTLRKLFDEHAGATGEILEFSTSFVLILDATFFGRGYGILMARSKWKVLYWQEIESESNSEYLKCFLELENRGYLLSAIVVDGRQGVRHLIAKHYPLVPVQFCQFHQVEIVKRYIPQRARTEAGRELRKITLGLTKTCEMEFTQDLEAWHAKYAEFLKEKSPVEDTNRWRYTHRRLRSAYRSLRKNLPYLFTYQNHPALGIPNTTNHCDGLFSHLKQKIGIHRGISKQRRKKMIDYFLENF